MTRLLSAIGLALLLGGAAQADPAARADSAAQADPATEPPPVRAALESLDHEVKSAMAADALPGLAIAVVEGDRPIWARGYGLADIAAALPVTAATRFRLASMSKLFTALAIVQLRDAGKLDLDDPVARHLAWYRLADDPHPALTIRELLLQLGGLPREAPGGSWNDRVMPSREALIAALTSEPAAIPPETQWKYSNLGYAVLGLVVEAASGESYADYVTRHILAPLGMAETVVEPAPDLPGLATGYGKRIGSGREVRPFLPMGGVTPAAGIVSSAGDMARFLGWMLDETDGPVLAARSRREMLRVQAMLPDWSTGQGLGFELRRVGGDLRIGHSGRAAGYAGRLEIDPASRLGVVVLTNADENGPGHLIDRAIALLAPAMAAAAPTAPGAPDPAWTKYVGTYRNEGRDSAIALIEGRLAWIDPQAPDPVRTRIFLEPAGPDRFRFTAGALIGETLLFETDNSGRVVSMRAAGATDWKQ